jgi:hypothetical protein
LESDLDSELAPMNSPRQSASLQPHPVTLEEMLDTMALQKLAWTYCHAVDRRDYRLLRSLYHDDAVDDHGDMFRGTPDEYIAWLPTMLAQWEATSHVITNTLFLIDGDRGEGELSPPPIIGRPGHEGDDCARPLSRSLREARWDLEIPAPLAGARLNSGACGPYADRGDRRSPGNRDWTLILAWCAWECLGGAPLAVFDSRSRAGNTSDVTVRSDIACRGGGGAPENGHL